MNFILVIAVFAVLAGVVLPLVVTILYCLMDRPASEEPPHSDRRVW